MNKFIKNIIAFSLKNKAFTFIWVAILAIAGFISFKNMPIEAFPDVTNTQIVSRTFCDNPHRIGHEPGSEENQCEKYHHVWAFHC